MTSYFIIVHLRRNLILLHTELLADEIRRKLVVPILLQHLLLRVALQDVVLDFRKHLLLL